MQVSYAGTITPKVGEGVSPVEKSFLENPNELFCHFIGGNWVIYLFLKSSPSKRTGISTTGMAESGFYSESCEAKVCDWTKRLLPGRQEHVRPLTCLLRSFGKLVTEKKGKHTPNTTFFFFFYCFSIHFLQFYFFAASGLSLVVASGGYSLVAGSGDYSPIVVLRLESTGPAVRMCGLSCPYACGDFPGQR